MQEPDNRLSNTPPKNSYVETTACLEFDKQHRGKRFVGPNRQN